MKPTDVKFDLKGISDNFNGNGYFKIVGDSEAEVTGSLDLAAGGMMGMMIYNSVLENFVPKATKGIKRNLSKQKFQNCTWCKIKKCCIHSQFEECCIFISSDC